MVELTTAFAVLSMFLGWRVYVVSHRLHMAEVLLRGIVNGKIEVQQTDDGFRVKILEKNNG